MHGITKAVTIFWHIGIIAIVIYEDSYGHEVTASHTVSITCKINIISGFIS